MTSGVRIARFKQAGGGSQALTVKEAVYLFRRRLGYDEESPPPAQKVLPIGLILTLVKAILGAHWVKIVCEGDEPRFSETTIGIVRDSWQRIFGDPLDPAFLSGRVVEDCEVEEFLGHVVRASIVRTGTIEDLDLVIRRSAANIAPTTQDYRWWARDADFVDLDQIVGEGGLAADAFSDGFWVNVDDDTPMVESEDGAIITLT